jgi:hypothetical protein
VRDVLGVLGVGFDLWQQGLAQLILSKRADGSYVATVGGVLLSIARQTGKTYVIRWVVFALCCIFPGIEVVWTSHHGATTARTLAEFDAMSQTPAVRPFVAKVAKSRGTDESVHFVNGSVIRFGSREYGFGRGFDAVAILVFDEAQIMTDRALRNMTPAANTGVNPLLVFMGTPPTPTDPSEVFTELRKQALAGDGDAILVEISGDPVPEGVDPMEWIRDPKQWEKGNPSYRTGRTNRNSMLRLLKMLTLNGPDDFLREGIGVWDSDGPKKEAIPSRWWSDAQVGGFPLPEDQRIVTDFTVCVHVTRDRRWAFVARCGERADGWAQVELVAKLRPGSVTGWLKEHRARIREVVGQARGAGKTSELVASWVGDPAFDLRVTPWQGVDLMDAFGRGMDALGEGLVRSVGHPDLDFCVPRVVWKDLGGGQIIDGAKSGAEMAPLIAWFGAYGMRTRFVKPVNRVRIMPTVITV